MGIERGKPNREKIFYISFGYINPLCKEMVKPVLDVVNIGDAGGGGGLFGELIMHTRIDDEVWIKRG